MYLTRKAIIIGSPDSKYGRLDGVVADHENYRAFLTSPAGGAWEHREIEDVGAVSSASLEKTIVAAGSADFSLVVFAGHGGHNARTDQTVVCINDNEEVPVERLNTGSRRQLTIIDACRTIIVPELLEKFAARLDEVKRSLTDSYRASCRAYYDAMLLQAEMGQVYMYGCSVSEAAGDGANGGVFSRTLLTQAENWSEQRTRSWQSPQQANAVLSLKEAFDLVAASFRGRRITQTPVLEEGRRRKSFPFVVR